MAFETLLARYGLMGIFLGSGIEGEAVVLTGGFLAHRGLFPLAAVMLVSALGSCLVDQAWFLVGRRFRNGSYVTRVTAKPAFSRAVRLVERYPDGFIFGFRFIYGLRTVSPIAIGTTRVSTRRFMVLNVLAAAIWGPLFSWVGYQFGTTIDPLLDRLHREMFAPILALAAIAVSILVLATLWKRQR